MVPSEIQDNSTIKLQELVSLYVIVDLLLGYDGWDVLHTVGEAATIDYSTDQRKGSACVWCSLVIVSTYWKLQMNCWRYGMSIGHLPVQWDMSTQEAFYID